MAFTELIFVGMKMKISFARATCHNRDILILDEPAAGLDPVAREEMADMLLDFVSDENQATSSPILKKFAITSHS